MVLELHVWGPAFSLPSIDAECLAAIAYFSRAVPLQEWVIIASSDPTLSPKADLPVLKDGPTLTSGFKSIIEYVRQYSNGEWDLDSTLDTQESADVTAYTSFIESQGRPLIDLSLYVSSLNYASCTRPAYSAILAWPDSWILPPRIREQAKKRSEHLGLSSLDVDSSDAPGKAAAELRSDQIPANLLKRPKETVSSLLGQHSHQSRFRLDGLSQAFFGPLDDLLSRKDCLIYQSQTTSLDCLAIGYLALALLPQLPHHWLQESLKSNFPRLASYTERKSLECFGKVADTASSPLASSKTMEKRSEEVLILPWRSPERTSIKAIGCRMLDNITDSLPIVSQIRSNNRLRHAVDDADLSDMERRHLRDLSEARNREIYTRIFAVAAVITTFLGYILYTGILDIEGARENGEEETSYGEAGALLGLGNTASSLPTQAGNGGIKDEPVPGVEVEVTSNTDM